MEVLLGPTYGMDASAPSPAYVSGLPAQDKVLPPSSCLFLKGDSVAGDRLPLNKIEAGYGSGHSSDRSSSSIGDPGDSEDDVSSSKTDDHSSNKLSLDSLEDSLPIKRGLSSHFKGKSKSYANLADVCSLKDLEKPENPFNKRRRVLMANKWSRSGTRKSSFYSWQNPKSMPLLVLNEEEQEQDDDGSEKGADNFSANNRKEDEARTKLGESRLSKMGFSQSCFSLADLHEEHHLQ